MTTDSYLAPWQEKEIPTTDEGDNLFATPKVTPAKHVCASAAIHVCSGDLWRCEGCDKHFCWSEGSDDAIELCNECWYQAHLAEKAHQDVRPVKRIIAKGVSKYGAPFTITSADDPHGFNATLMALRADAVAPLASMSDEVADEIDSEWIGLEHSTTGGHPL